MELATGATPAGDAEILDEMVTRSRGEVRHICSPKITSSTATPAKEFTGIQSPRLSAVSPRISAVSPRVSELRGISPQSGRTGPYSPRISDAQPSKLGRSDSTSK